MSVNLTINGIAVTGNEGETILKIAERNGIHIPTLCHDDIVKLYGACGMCVVEVQGSGKLLRACSTVATDGMVVNTESDRVIRARKIALELLMSDHVGDCRGPCTLECPAGTDCQGYVKQIALGNDREAVRIIKDKVPLPASIGRVCPHPCETACRRNYIEKPISIAYLKAFAADNDLKSASPFIPEMDSKKGKSVAIIGGGNVGYMLAKNLEEMRIKSKIIEKNYDRCEYLSQELNSTLVINGDGTDLKLLDDEEIGECDVVISVTNNDERNLLCSLLVKQLGVKRVIARVSKVLNIPLFEKVGIDIAVSSKTSAINEVRNDLDEADVDILATVEQGEAEVLEMPVKADFDGKLIKDISLPVPAIIGVIQRRSHVIIPKGDTMIRLNDILIIFTKAEDADTIKEYFKAVTV